MHPTRLRALLQSVQQGERTVEAALAELRDLPFADLGFARVDHHRPLRTGFPEVVFAQDKTAAQTAAILAELARAGHNAFATRVPESEAGAIVAAVPGA